MDLGKVVIGWPCVRFPMLNVSRLPPLWRHTCYHPTTLIVIKCHHEIIISTLSLSYILDSWVFSQTFLLNTLQFPPCKCSLSFNFHRIVGPVPSLSTPQPLHHFTLCKVLQKDNHISLSSSSYDRLWDCSHCWSLPRLHQAIHSM